MLSAVPAQCLVYTAENC